MWGNKPYDKEISPVENLAVSLAALGEGWHNYHHVFPWDYKTSELGMTFHTQLTQYTSNLCNVINSLSGNGKFNPTTAFIDFFAKLGWAYDLKSVSPNMVARRAHRSGDGTHDSVWGYGDADIPAEDAEELEAMSQESMSQKKRT